MSIDANNYTEQLWRSSLGILSIPAGQGRHAVEGGGLRGRPAQDERGRSEEASISRRVTAGRSGISTRRSRPRSTSLYDDAKKSLWTELTPGFIDAIPNVLPVRTQSKDRNDYIAHPPTGEILDPESLAAIVKLRDSWGGNVPKAQIVISDGLNANAIMDKGHLAPYLEEMRRLLREAGVPMSDKNILVTSGRVRVGYRIGETLFEGADPNSFRGILHIIGERPGTVHHAYSVYITVAQGKVWAREEDRSRHHKLVSNVADTALPPKEAARETLTIIREVVGKNVSGSRRHAT